MTPLGGGDTAEAVFAMVANRMVALSSKRRVPEWARADVLMPGAWFSDPPLHSYYRAVEAVAEAKERTEEHLYARLTDLGTPESHWVFWRLSPTNPG